MTGEGLFLLEACEEWQSRLGDTAKEGMMDILAISGSPKKGGSQATLVAETIRGAVESGATVEEIRLADQRIGYCRFCLVCARDLEAPIGPCSQKDDMAQILEKISQADGLILSCPASSGQTSALMKTFEERCVYTLGRPTRRILWVKGCPASRLGSRQRFTVILTTAGVVPTWSRVFCSGSTAQMASLARGIFHAKVVRTLFVGPLWQRGLTQNERIRAYALGQKLATAIKRHEKERYRRASKAGQC